jgi:hypothetical protein
MSESHAATQILENAIEAARRGDYESAYSLFCRAEKDALVLKQAQYL